jgi:hypothetical protein
MTRATPPPQTNKIDEATIKNIKKAVKIRRRSRIRIPLNLRRQPLLIFLAVVLAKGLRIICIFKALDGGVPVEVYIRGACRKTSLI